MAEPNTSEPPKESPEVKIPDDKPPPEETADITETKPNESKQPDDPPPLPQDTEHKDAKSEGDEKVEGEKDGAQAGPAQAAEHGEQPKSEPGALPVEDPAKSPEQEPAPEQGLAEPSPPIPQKEGEDDHLKDSQPQKEPGSPKDAPQPTAGNAEPPPAADAKAAEDGAAATGNDSPQKESAPPPPPPQGATEQPAGGPADAPEKPGPPPADRRAAGPPRGPRRRAWRRRAAAPSISCLRKGRAKTLPLRRPTACARACARARISLRKPLPCEGRYLPVRQPCALSILVGQRLRASPAFAREGRVRASPWENPCPAKAGACLRGSRLPAPGQRLSARPETSVALAWRRRRRPAPFPPRSRRNPHGQ